MFQRHLGAAAALAGQLWRRAAAGFGFCGGLGLRGDLGAFGGQRGVDGGGFGGVDLVVVLVGFGELLLVQQQAAEAVGGAQLVVGVHLDGVEGADLDADLAAHADGDIDVEDCGVELQLADGIRLFVRALFDEDALRRAFLFADLAGDAAHALLPVGAVVDEEGKAARRLDLRQALLGILDRGQPVFADVAAEEIPGRLRQSLQDAFTDH